MVQLTQSNTWSEDFNLPPRHGFLNHDILQRICRFLPRQKDCYQACFIDQAWRYAATSVLWEAPEFRTAQSFKAFLKNIAREKRLALQVKHLTLCLPDIHEDTLFSPITQSEQSQHKVKNTIVSRAEAIHYVTQCCQHLTSLSLYGWNLQQRDIDQIFSSLPQLERLKVIGEPSATFQINAYLPRLHGLILDGLYPITRSFAQAITSKAHHLTSLHLSLSFINKDTYSVLFENEAALDLKELTLTHGKNLNDQYAGAALSRFVNLRKFILEGTIHLTPAILKIALDNCHRLQHLEIRQAPVKRLPTTNLSEDWDLGRSHTDLRTLITEYLWLDNTTLDNIAFYCPNLTSLGLAHTGTDLTDIGMEALFNASLNYLRHIHLIDCPMVTSDSLSFFPLPSLYTLHLECNGHIVPADVYKICYRAVEQAAEYGLRPNLRCLRVVGYESVAKSVIGAHAVERVDHQDKQWSDASSSTPPSDDTDYQVTLDEQAIDALAHSDDFVVVPENKHLTGQQIVLLARKLRVPLLQLIQALEELEEPNPLRYGKGSKARPQLLKQHSRPSTPSHWVNTNLGDLNQMVTSKKRAATLALDSYSQLARPASGSTASDTLSAYSEQNFKYFEDGDDPDVEQNGSEDIDQSEDNNGDQEEQEQDGDNEDDEYELEDGDDDDDDNECNNGANEMGDTSSSVVNYDEQWPSLTPTEDNGNDGNSISLGGWGTGIAPWVAQSTRKSSKISIRHKDSTSISSHNLENNAINWGYTTEENIVKTNDWQVVTMESMGPLQKKKGKFTALDVGSDQWGRPEDYVPWEKTEPFSRKILDQQVQTTYWQKLENGEWKVVFEKGSASQCNYDNVDILVVDDNGSEKKRGNDATPVFSRRERKPKFATNSSSPPASPHIPSRNVIYSGVDRSGSGSNSSSSNSSNSNNSNNNYLSSDDTDIDWDEEDKITIKTTSNTPSFSTGLRKSQYASSSGKEREGSDSGGGEPVRKPRPWEELARILNSHALEGAQTGTNKNLVKTNGRESRAGKYRHSRSKVGPLPLTTKTSSFSSPIVSGTERWHEFAKSKSTTTCAATPVPATVDVTSETGATFVPVPATAATATATSSSSASSSLSPSSSSLSSLSPSSTTTNINVTADGLTTAVLIDTSDTTNVDERGSWSPKEGGSALNDFYKSMVDIQVDSPLIGHENYTSKNQSVEQEIILWQEEDRNGADSTCVFEDNRGSINHNDVTDMDDDLLLLGSLCSPLPVGPTNDKKDDDNVASANGAMKRIDDNDDGIDHVQSHPSDADCKHVVEKNDQDVGNDNEPRGCNLNRVQSDEEDRHNNVNGSPVNSLLNISDTAALNSEITPSATMAESVEAATTIAVASAVSASSVMAATTDHPAAKGEEDSDVNGVRKPMARRGGGGRGAIVLTVKIQSPNGEEKVLELFEKQDPKEKIHEFCVKNNMLEKEATLSSKLSNEYMERKSNMLLGSSSKKKKKKKT